MISDKEAEEIVKAAKTVAVVGMTDGSKPGRASFDIPVRLQKVGFKLYPVNPRITESLGIKAVSALADLAEKVDIVDIFRAGEAIPEIADELIALPPDKRPPVVWLQLEIRNPEAEARLEAAGFKVSVDRCLGVTSEKFRLPG